MHRRAVTKPLSLARAAVRTAVPDHAAAALATRLRPQPRRWLMMVQEPGTRERPIYDK